MVSAGLLLASPAVAHAQGGAVVNGAVGVATTDGQSNLEISGGIGYRFNRAMTFGIEFTHIPSLEPQGAFYPLAAAARICCGFANGDFDGHATAFTTNVKIEVPTVLRRVIPFVVGGGGIASITEEFPIYYGLPLASELSSLGVSIPSPNILPAPQDFSNTTLAMALTLGGGASVLATNHLAVDADLRVLKLLATSGRTIGRFQVGASYRF
jgi:opacity protein-like surface antigen